MMTDDEAADMQADYEYELALEHWREARDAVTETLADRGAAHYDKEHEHG